MPISFDFIKEKKSVLQDSPYFQSFFVLILITVSSKDNTRKHHIYQIFDGCENADKIMFVYNGYSKLLLIILKNARTSIIHRREHSNIKHGKQVVSRIENTFSLHDFILSKSH